jgi:hypothetical protein
MASVLKIVELMLEFLSRRVFNEARERSSCKSLEECMGLLKL